jgi:hypothetical protein
LTTNIALSSLYFQQTAPPHPKSVLYPEAGENTMSTEARINANRENAKRSTGPRSYPHNSSHPTGTAGQNNLTTGLYTRHAFVKPEERELYHEFCSDLLLDLKPDGPLEKILAADITSAAWRLRRCDIAEAELGDPWDETTGEWRESHDKARRSIERARTSAQNCMNKAMRELGKLQTRKQIGFELSGMENTGLVDYKEITEAHIKHQKSQKATPQSTGNNEQGQSDAEMMAAIHRFCSAGIPEDFLSGCTNAYPSAETPEGK